MQSFLLILAGLVAYIGGLVLIVKVTPRLLLRAYDEVWFMVFAVLDILGAFLTFGSIIGLLAIGPNNIGIKTLDFILLIIVMLTMGRMALSCFRRSGQGVQAGSRYGAGVFCLFLALAAIYYIVQLFKV